MRALLESQYEFVPNLAMEYVMYALIQERIETADGLGEETLALIPGQREYVVKILRKEYPDTSEMSDDGEDIFITWQEKLERLEDLHYYETVYFWGFDFLQLELFSEEDLLESPVSEFLGIENIWTEAEYVLSP